jgi:hypothetical protein
MNEEYTNALITHAHELGFEVVPATGPEAAPFLIRPTVKFVEPGFYAGLAAGSSEVRMHVRITAPDGRVLDDIGMEHGTRGSMIYPSSGQRYREDAKRLGRWTAEYLARRVGAAAA